MSSIQLLSLLFVISFNNLIMIFFLFHSGGNYNTAADYGTGSGVIFLDQVDCDGTEKKIADCSHWGLLATSHCTHAQDAGCECLYPGLLFKLHRCMFLRTPSIPFYKYPGHPTPDL